MAGLKTSSSRTSRVTGRASRPTGSHIASVKAQHALCLADRDYIKAAIAPADQRAALLQAAAANYQHSANLERVLILKYSVWEQVADKTFPKGVTRQNIDENTPDLTDITAKSVAGMEALLGKSAFIDDSGEYLQYIDRATARLIVLQASPTASAQPAH